MNANTFTRSEPATAAEWFAARRGRALHDESLERRFRDWLSSSTENFQAYALCELTWELTAAAAAGLSVPTTWVRWYRARWVTAVAASIAVALFAVTVVWGYLRMTSVEPIVASTQPGEQRLLQLTDGSRITLNTRSAVEVRLSSRERHIRIAAGEVFFDVAHESRPFIVETPLGTVRAVGTRFDVLLEDGRVEVNMEEGRVLVKGRAADAPEVAAGAGVRATLRPGDIAADLGSADLERVENWRANRIEFDRVALAVALKEFSRYTNIRIRASTPEIGSVAITAVLKTGDVDALRATLNAAFGLRLEQSGNELLVTEPHRR